MLRTLCIEGLLIQGRVTLKYYGTAVPALNVLQGGWITLCMDHVRSQMRITCKSRAIQEVKQTDTSEKNSDEVLKVLPTHRTAGVLATVLSALVTQPRRLPLMCTGHVLIGNPAAHIHEVRAYGATKAFVQGQRS
jgi:hypothetical protein